MPPPVRLELTDTEWMSVIDANRDGLPRCCANISALRDCLISAAREGGEIHLFAIDRLRMTLGWVLKDHEIDQLPVLGKIRTQLDLTGDQEHVPDTAPEDL